MAETKSYFINPNDKANTKLYTLISQWVKDKFSLPIEAEVSVSEIKCADPGCPDIDTYITLTYDGLSKRYRIAKPLVYVRKWDIDAMIEIVK